MKNEKRQLVKIFERSLNAGKDTLNRRQYEILLKLIFGPTCFYNPLQWPLRIAPSWYLVVRVMTNSGLNELGQKFWRMFERPDQLQMGASKAKFTDRQMPRSCMGAGIVHSELPN